MCLFVVSANTMVRGLLSDACAARTSGEVETFASVTEIGSLRPGDIVLLHTARPAADVAGDVAKIRSQGHGVRIIIVSGDDVTEQIRARLSTEVEAIVPEGHTTVALAGALSVVQEGYRVVYVPRDPGQETIRTGRPVADGDPKTLPPDVAPLARKSPAPARLSHRESAVLSKLREGVSNKEIAQQLGIEEATVKVHLRNCYRKIGARNRTQAAIWAAGNL